LEQVPGEDPRVVRTIVWGDNYAAENLDEVTAFVLLEADEAKLFIAGPCFQAGRYAVAAGAVCAG
jgi:glycine reductase